MCDDVRVRVNKGSVCIVGYPRSGTTLVYHILMSADVFPIFRFDETHYFSHFFQMYGSLSKAHNLKWLIDDLNKRGIIEDSVCFAQEVKKQHINFDITYESLFLVLMNFLSCKQGKKRWVEKTPWHMLYMKEIVKAVPDIKFIFLVRDPRAVTLSIKKAGWMPGATSLRFASAWKWHMMQAEKDIQKLNKHILTIRYEDVVFNLEKTLQRLSSFLGIDLTSEDVRKKQIGVIGGDNSSFGKIEGGNAVYTEAVDRWRGLLTIKEQAQINYLLADLLTKYGYDNEEHNSLSFFEKEKIHFFYKMYSVAKIFSNSFFVRKITGNRLLW